MARPPALLLIGIHREELAFGRVVAGAMDPTRVAVLAIPEGLSGRHPRPDQRFHFEMLHRALYQQVLPHVVGRHHLLIDLHTGFDRQGPCAELFCADAGLRACLQAAIAADGWLSDHEIRLIALEDGAGLHAETVIPRQVWDHPGFRYVGLEIYLPAPARGEDGALDLSRRLIGAVIGCADKHRLD